MNKTHKGLSLTPDEAVKARQILESSSIPEPNSGCHIWERCTIPKGYGWMYLNGTQTAAHRFSYAAYVGPVPRLMQVCHRCDMPQCVNPGHLFLGTSEENQNDKGRKQRSRMKFTPDVVVEMRAMYDAGMSQAAIAGIFGAGRSTVQGIVSRKFRPYVTDPAA